MLHQSSLGNSASAIRPFTGSMLCQMYQGYSETAQHALQGVESTTIRVGKYKIKFGKGERRLYCALQQRPLSCLLLCPARYWLVCRAPVWLCR